MGSGDSKQFAVDPNFLSSMGLGGSRYRFPSDELDNAEYPRQLAYWLQKNEPKIYKQIIDCPRRSTSPQCLSPLGQCSWMSEPRQQCVYNRYMAPISLYEQK